MLPWYRRPGYKGNLTEAQKRELDAFRTQAKHPSTRFEDLPEEVQGYIAGLELNVYDLRQEKAASLAIVCSLVGIALLYSHYFGKPLSLSVSWAWTFGLLLMIAPWFVYRHEWKKNAKEFDLPVDERLRREWELDYLARHREDEGHGAQ